jgi:Protein of unknown function (DUF1569)
MKSLFEPSRVEEVKERIARLTPESQRQWGTMTVAQMLAHCSIGIDTASGAAKPPRMLIGRILGRVIKPMALKDDAPMRKNSPTAPIFIVKGEPDFEAAREQLLKAIDEFAAAGPAGCTAHPHAFFGRLKPDEWAGLMYKHVDHHLRQFGV